jgi:ADP-ribosyl-[dinitrogen reductase] hydrolase
MTRNVRSNIMPTLNDRILGCIVGGAIGDYVGCSLEGRSGPFDVSIPASSRITDDTQLTLATCEAITSARGVEPEAIARAFSRWFSQGRITGYGSSTLKALRDLQVGAHWALSGAKGGRSAGNGAAMRIAPVAFCVDPFGADGRQLVKHVASITHRDDEAICGALAIAIAIAHDGFDYVPRILSELPDCVTRHRLAELASRPNVSITDLGIEYGTSGYVADSAPVSLIAAQRAEAIGFQDAVFGVIACGGDTDTTGSMAAQIIGSKIGLSGIPEELRSLRFGLEDVNQIASDFANYVCGN